MRNFLKQTFSSLIGSLLGLIIFCGVGTTGIFLLLLAATASKDTGPNVKDKSIVVFDLSMNITDGEPSGNDVLQKAISGVQDNRMSLRSVLDAWKRRSGISELWEYT